MIEKIIIVHVVIFAVLLSTKALWSKLLLTFNMESIFSAISKLIPAAAISIILVKIPLLWGDKIIIAMEAAMLLPVCDAAYYLHKRSKGLEASFGITRMKPTDGALGCLSDGIVIFSAVTILLGLAIVQPSTH